MAKKPRSKFYETDQDIDNATASAARRGESLRNEYHKIGCSILRRWLSTGDYRPAERQLTALHNALGGAVRTNAFKDWVVAHTLMEWDGETNSFSKVATTVEEDNVKKAIATPFWDFTKEAKWNPMDWAAQLQSLVKRAHKDMEKAQSQGEESKVNPDQLAALEAMIPAGGK